MKHTQKQALPGKRASSCLPGVKTSGFGRKRRFRGFYSLFPPLILAGCLETTPGPSAKPSQTAPIDTSAAAVSAAVTTVDTKTEERDAKLRANIDAAKSANENNPDGPPKIVVDSELGVAQDRLATVSPDPTEAANAAQRRLLVEQGKVEEARKLYSEASDKAKKLEHDLLQARKDLDEAIAKDEKVRKDFALQLESNRRESERKLKEAVDAERNKFLRIITWSLTAAGIICGLLAAFSAYVSVQAGDLMKAVTRAGVWLLFAGLFVASAWTMNQPWFKWIIIVGGFLSLVAVGLMTYINWRDAREKREGKQRTVEADEAEGALSKVMEVLDKLPDGHDLFKELSGAMSDNHKALIHELRAEKKRKTS